MFRSLRHELDPLDLEMLERAFDATCAAVKEKDVCRCHGFCGPWRVFVGFGAKLKKRGMGDYSARTNCPPW